MSRPPFSICGALGCPAPRPAFASNAVARPALRTSRGGPAVRVGIATAVLGLLLATGRAAPVEREVGDGLVYARVHATATDLPTDARVRNHPCVLDLRFARGDATAATVLASWLGSHAAPKTPVFVLVNAATDSALLRVLADHDPATGLLVIGIAGQPFKPDILVEDTSDDERRAYELFEHGTTIRTLTTDFPNKRRDDEASLSQTQAPEADDPAETDPKPPPIDEVLQRAIQVYRGLRAMKQL